MVAAIRAPTYATPAPTPAPAPPTRYLPLRSAPAGEATPPPRRQPGAGGRTRWSVDRQTGPDRLSPKAIRRDRRSIQPRACAQRSASVQAARVVTARSQFGGLDALRLKQMRRAYKHSVRSALVCPSALELDRAWPGSDGRAPASFAPRYAELLIMKFKVAGQPLRINPSRDLRVEEDWRCGTDFEGHSTPWSKCNLFRTRYPARRSSLNWPPAETSATKSHWTTCRSAAPSSQITCGLGPNSASQNHALPAADEDNEGELGRPEVTGLGHLREPGRSEEADRLHADEPVFWLPVV